MNNRGAKLLMLIVIAGLAAALWYSRASLTPEPEENISSVESALIDADKPVQRGPRHPLPPPTPPAAIDDDIAPVRPLDDNGFRAALMRNFGPDVGSVLANDALIDKFVVTVDNLTRPQVAERVRAVGRLPDEFSADAAEEAEEFILRADNYERYELFVYMAVNTDPETIAATYRRFYPVFQEAYVEIGYPEGYFNDRVVEVIDLLLLTPEPDEPIRLIRPHVLYKFADAELESLSSGQKLLIRMGSENAAKIKQVLKELRVLITPAPEF